MSLAGLIEEVWAGTEAAVDGRWPSEVRCVSWLEQAEAFEERHDLEPMASYARLSGAVAVCLLMGCRDLAEGGDGDTWADAAMLCVGWMTKVAA